VTTEPAADAELRELVDTFITLMRSFNKAKARLVAAAEHDVEWSAHLLLRCIARGDGPMRAAELAGVMQSDPATVSRQVAALVKEGYLERRADPADGRASLLVLTPRADALLAEHDQIRLQHFARVVDGWSEADLKRFTVLLRQFTQAYETVTTTDWIAERVATRPARAGSTH
jgi:DNA-binding MarR family transcriptional regulator